MLLTDLRAVIVVGLIVALVLFLITLIPNADVQKWGRVIVLIIAGLWLLSVLFAMLPGGSTLLR